MSKQIAVRLPDELVEFVGLSSEVRVDTASGLAEPSVVSCDDITTIPVAVVGEQIGMNKRV